MTLEEVTTLKEAIKRLKEVIKEVRSTIQPFLYDNEAKDYILKALEQPKWIPVSEHLPKADGMYLVTTTGTYNDVVDIAYYYKDIGFHKASKVLAWMQLPEAYKEGGAV